MRLTSVTAPAYARTSSMSPVQETTFTPSKTVLPMYSGPVAFQTPIRWVHTPNVTAPPQPVVGSSYTVPDGRITRHHPLGRACSSHPAKRGPAWETAVG